MNDAERDRRFAEQLVVEVKAAMARAGVRSSRALGRMIGETSQYMSTRLDGGSPKSGVRVALDADDLWAIGNALGVLPSELVRRAEDALDRQAEIERVLAERVLATTIDAVFPSAAGTWRDPGNVRKVWRIVRGKAGLDWVTPHSLRRTVATLLHAEADLATAAAQLGDTEAMTKARYVAREVDGPAVGALLHELVVKATEQAEAEDGDAGEAAA